MKIFGIRHHGPGSAKSLIAAFADAPPDALVIEAPEELAALLPWLDDPALTPPVAALVWSAEDAKRASFYPFAIFSPEWQALRWARQRGIAVYCMDLPMRHALAGKDGDGNADDASDEAAGDGEAPAEAPAVEPAAEAAPDTAAEPQPAPALEATEPSAPPKHPESPESIDLPEDDPVTALARAAGYDDGEAWWEHLVEAEGHAAFDAITEAMGAARAAGLGRDDLRNRRREAHMRQTLRLALKAGHARVAVVCGAFHAPALTAAALKAHAVKDDAALLKGLPKVKTEATWVPWASSRLAFASGYGAGVEAPGWYAHLFDATASDTVATHWLARLAQALRAEDLDAPSASVIEAVRLAEALATLRRRRSPDLAELREAALATFCHGEALTLKLAEEHLLGLSPRFDVLGTVPEALPQSPLQQDFAALNKRLRLKTEALEKRLELDLREAGDRARSVHFWRLSLMGVDWADPDAASRGKGSFKEAWRLRWPPESALALIAAGRHGASVAEAADAMARRRIAEAKTLPALLDVAGVLLKAQLDATLAAALVALDARAAAATDIHELLAALPPLMSLLRYGDARGTGAQSLGLLLRSLLTRSAVALPNACAQLSPEAAAELLPSVVATHTGLQTLDDPALLDDWLAALASVAAAATTPALLAGRSVRLLLDAARLTADDAAGRLRFALATAQAPLAAAQWLEGFVAGSVHLLLGRPELRALIGDWLAALPAEAFVAVLPLVRRAFSDFAPAERRLLLDAVLRGGSGGAHGDGEASELADGYELEAFAQLRDTLRVWLGVTPALPTDTTTETAAP